MTNDRTKVNIDRVIVSIHEENMRKKEIWDELILPKAKELVERGYKWETAKKMATNAVKLNINI